MDKFVIKGGTPLRGEVQVSGAKNAALAILPAAILSDDICIIENLPNIKDTASILELFDNNNLKYVKLAKNQQADIDDEIVIKILFEKIFIKTFVYGDLESYVDLSYLNFDYPKYDIEQIKEYYLKNKQSVEISMMIFKEKIINLTSFLRFDDLPLNKFIKFLNNL